MLLLKASGLLCCWFFLVFAVASGTNDQQKGWKGERFPDRAS